MDKIQGTKPTILIVDEHTPLVNVDFAKLEKLVAHLGGDGYHHPQFDQIPRYTVTGRIRRGQPEFQELPGVRELQAKAWGELLHRAFESPEARQLFKDLTFLDRYSNPEPFKDYAKQPGLPAFHSAKDVGTDHPSRKREPKGPRGKWGKL